MTDSQKRFIRECYEGARGMAQKEKKSFRNLKFVDAFVCIKRSLLKELLRRAYMTIRVKKWGNGYKCFLFEVLVPFEIKDFDDSGQNCKIIRFDSCEIKSFMDSDFEIVKLGKIDVNATRASIDTTIEKYLKYQMYIFCNSNNPKKLRDKFGWFRDYTCGNIAYSIFRSQAALKDTQVEFLLHTHFWKQQPEKFSEGDLLALNEESPCFCLCALRVDERKFMEKVKKLGANAFDENNFLRLEYIKNIAKYLADECSGDYFLKRFCYNLGLPLIAARKNWDQLELYTKLKIT